MTPRETPIASEIDDIEVEECGLTIETANGNFYQSHKRGLHSFLDEIEFIARNTLNKSEVTEIDAVGLNRALSGFDRHREELFPLLEKSIDARAPTLFDECAISAIWSLLEAAYLIGHHASLAQGEAVKSIGIRLAERGVVQSELARKGRAKKHREEREDQFASIRETRTFKNAGGVNAKVTALAKESGLPDHTVRRCLAKMGRPGRKRP